MQAATVTSRSSVVATSVWPGRCHVHPVCRLGVNRGSVMPLARLRLALVVAAVRPEGRPAWQAPRRATPARVLRHRQATIGRGRLVAAGADAGHAGAPPGNAAGCARYHGAEDGSDRSGAAPMPPVRRFPRATRADPGASPAGPHRRVRCLDVDATSGLVHTVIGTAGNVADVTQAHALLHGDETAALGDAGYQGVEKRPENIGKTVRSMWP